MFFPHAKALYYDGATSALFFTVQDIFCSSTRNIFSVMSFLVVIIQYQLLCFFLGE